MSKKDLLLKAFRKNVNEWVCGYCNSGSNQPAATFREIKKLGYIFEEPSPSRWGKEMYCKICDAKRTHYKLLSDRPVFEEKPRLYISANQRDRILKLLNWKDAFTGASISSTPEIDHKIPWTRLDKDIDPTLLNDEEIIQHFQLLTREHNLLKDRACGFCKTHSIRPPFLEIEYWYKGDNNYMKECEGCGWHDGNEWRKSINIFLNNKK